ncbi:hypothetical protein BOO69_04970 [Sulfitobacter alexandrii]|uniref:Excalibur calcium-binding domain-containing protein n=1 Tax=Sulfitobacter alexandrii TaxID=1917485 RepID=A0A1J0WF90_9RHOB|nr:hypothetical protein [Sulfitobacter alexandrii]APE42848.1 hypothetical protein BOO69_04970 [Sulfitobacter alexandrii]
MIARSLILVATGVALAACQPAVPDSGRGVGFGDSDRAQRQARDAALAGGTVPAPAAVTAAPLPTPAEGSAEATAAETARVLAATRPGAGNGIGNDAATNSGVAPVNASPSNPPPAVLNSAGISNENNFDAVSGQRSIGDDAARLAANRAQYQVVQPQALPDRADAGPNIVAYALRTTNARGTQVYRRIGLNKASKFARACAQYSHPDQAQIAFLEAGGPEKDRNGMDPDGDGFACNWDPTPFRRAARAG